jgi:hypothetical protein
MPGQEGEPRATFNAYLTPNVNIVLLRRPSSPGKVAAVLVITAADLRHGAKVLCGQSTRSYALLGLAYVWYITWKSVSLREPI